MRSYLSDFDLDQAHVWLNAASEGPIPKVSVQALNEAIFWKASPHRLTIPKFQQIPLELKQSIARCAHVDPDDVILGNSATYGMHILANGIPFEEGDEILLMQNDFPTDILPWLHLKDKGVKVKQLTAKNSVLGVEELKNAMTPRTKLICLPFVHTFSGHALDIVAIGNLAQKHGILLVVNMSQAIGAFDVKVESLPVDAVVCAGYKWLLGPYGTGFCWIKEGLRKTLDYPQAYWVSLMNEQELNSTEEISLRKDHSTRSLDVFATANFFNFVPWRASIEYLLGVGVDTIALHNRTLVNYFIDHLDRDKFTLLSAVHENMRSNLVVFSHKNKDLNSSLMGVLKDKGIHLAFWKGNLRVSPHIYNGKEDMDRLLNVLNQYDEK